MRRFYLILFVALSIFNLPLYASEALSGEKVIQLSGPNTEPLEIGHIQFRSENGKVFYDIKFKDGVFSDEFLSMRPFRCIHQSKQMVCHLAYPYAMQGHITEDDLTDLEYDLLFLHKSANEYGIDPWNGLYYDLAIKGKGLEGTLKEVDLNILAAPPEDETLRPITDDMLHEADPGNHLFPRLIIKSL